MCSVCTKTATSSLQPTTHALLSLQRWARDKVLSFVPPDGKFKLMDYRFAPATASAVSQAAVPFILRTSVVVDEHGGSIDLTLSSRLTTRTMENVYVELYLGEGATGANCLASHNASWTFNPRTHVSLTRSDHIYLCVSLS